MYYNIRINSCMHDYVYMNETTRAARTAVSRLWRSPAQPAGFGGRGASRQPSSSPAQSELEY